jgi:ribA/ribD-fused uncharacterized protein
VGDPVEISAFTGEYAFLSNFYVGAAPLAFHGRTYASGEHMFQAFKATGKADHERIAGMATPGEARAEGKHLLRMRGDWERAKYDVMRLVLLSKFRPGREEGPLLLATGDALLIEGSMWGDQVWGVDLKEGRATYERRHAIQLGWEAGEGWEDAPGRNWLGVLLMARRAELLFEQRDARRASAMHNAVARFAMDVPR